MSGFGSVASRFTRQESLLPLIPLDVKPRVAHWGDSTGGAGGIPPQSYFKRAAMIAGVDLNNVGITNPAVSGISNEVQRDDEYSSWGGYSPAQIAAEIPAAYATVLAANGRPQLNVIWGNYNGTADLQGLRGEWNLLFDTFYDLDPSPNLLVMGAMLQAGSYDGTQEIRREALDLALMDQEAKGRRIATAPMQPYTAHPMDDRLTTDGTHANIMGSILQAIAGVARMLGMSPVVLEKMCEGLCEMHNGRGGRLALWCLAAVAGTATVELATFDRFGRMGGRGVAQANTQGTFSLAGITTTGNTVKNLINSNGGFEASMVRARVLRVSGNNIYAWPGAALDGSVIEVPSSMTTKPRVISVGDYATITPTSNPAEVWLG